MILHEEEYPVTRGSHGWMVGIEILTKCDVFVSLWPFH